MVNATPRSLYLRGKRPGTHCTGGWVGPRAGLDRVRKISPPPGLRSPAHSAPSESLYRLPDYAILPHTYTVCNNNNNNNNNSNNNEQLSSIRYANEVFVNSEKLSAIHKFSKH